MSWLSRSASIWLTAAIGTAAGGGLPLLAVLATVLFFVAVPGYTALVRALPRSRLAPSALQVDYRDGEGVLRTVLATCTQLGFAVHHLSSRHSEEMTVSVWLEVQGAGRTAELAAELGEIDGVLRVVAEDVNVSRE